ncbi:MAG: hypothetical protein HWE26_13070 [Alteromonadaceae bacterium]|nr:hypothetical protein [Alteromonadaceae bacterium]
MQSTFDEITLFGENKPKINYSDVNSAAIKTVIGLLFSALAIVLLAVSVTALNYRKNWFFGLLIVYSVILTLMIPISLLLGLAGMFSLLLLLFNSKEFGDANHPT